MYNVSSYPVSSGVMNYPYWRHIGRLAHLMGFVAAKMNRLLGASLSASSPAFFRLAIPDVGGDW